MNISIRDDDINFFSNPEILEVAYGDLLFKVPITLGCIPFVKKDYIFFLSQCGSSNGEKFVNYVKSRDELNKEQQLTLDEIYHLSNNKRLVEFIKGGISDGKFEIALHGIHHTYNEYGPEFLHENISVNKIEEAKKYLESTFDVKVGSFIPPSNAISYRSAINVAGAGLNILTSSRISCAQFLERVAFLGLCVLSDPNYLRAKLFRRGRVNHRFKRVNCYYSHTFRLSDTADTFLSRARQDFSRTQFLSIATHHSELAVNTRYRANFIDLVDRLIDQYGLRSFTKTGF